MDKSECDDRLTLWKKEKVRPTQPYFVFDTQHFMQEIYPMLGISHFYAFNIADNTPLRVVPDGCIDLFFEYGKDKMQGYICGTKLGYDVQDWSGANEVFAVRFLPGVQPELLGVTMKDILDRKIPIESGMKGSDREWLKALEQETDFYQRIRIFLEVYTRLEKHKVKPYGKKEILHSIKSMVYLANGNIKISEISSNTGYTERYINKVFIEEMGFSPKIFCKIIQFQRSLEFLNYGAPDKMTDAAVYLGFYDQPHFIRDFTRYAGITPKQYLKLVNDYDYKGRIITGQGL